MTERVRRPTHRHGGAGRRRRNGRPDGRAPDGTLRLYGRHAVAAALANANRPVTLLTATPNALKGLDRLLIEQARCPIETVSPAALDALVGADARHQGLVLTAGPLPAVDIDSLAPRADTADMVLVLDQVTDPHNVGACLRSAAAFGARALVTQKRHAPPESGPLAKAASGALEVVPWVRATNLTAALDRLADMGYWRLGLAGDAPATLGEADLSGHIALVVGSEGRGLRPLVARHCDLMARIPITELAESLNVSNAAAVALYAAAAARPGQRRRG